MEDVKYVQRDNGDGTQDVTYISRHICMMTWPHMMDIYHDQRIILDTEAREYHAKHCYAEQDRKIYHTWLDENTCHAAEHYMDLAFRDRADLLAYCQKFAHVAKGTSPHGPGQGSCQFAIDSLCAPPHPFVDRNNHTHMGGSAMFEHEDNTPETPFSNIYCVRDVTIPADADLYKYLIVPMSNATEKQAVYAEIQGHSKATAETLLKCTDEC